MKHILLRKCWRVRGKSVRMIFTYQTAHTPLKSQGYRVVRNEERKKYIQKHITFIMKQKKNRQKQRNQPESLSRLKSLNTLKHTQSILILCFQFCACVLSLFETFFSTCSYPYILFWFTNHHLTTFAAILALILCAK